jgi:myosin heavy subunit
VTQSELLRLHNEAKEARTASSTIASTRQEVADLAQLVQRLEAKLSSWRAELAAEVSDEVRAIASARDADVDAERLKVESLQRDVSQVRSTCCDLEEQRKKVEGLQRDGNHVRSACCELEARVEGLKIELSSVLNSRADFEQRLKDSQQLLARRLESFVAEPMKEVEMLRKELEGVSQHFQRSEQRWRSEVSQEIRTVACSREQEARETSSRLEEVRREAAASISSLQLELEGRVERLQVEIATVVATRDALEHGSREGHDELRKLVDSRISSTTEELAALERRLVAEMRAETRAALKNEQNALAALDEQLWLTDQRLGQRIDEIAIAHERRSVMVYEERPGTGGACLNSVTETEQLERLRNARRQRANAGLINGALTPSKELVSDEAACIGGWREASSREMHGPLAMASKAAEAFNELGTGRLKLSS